MHQHLCKGLKMRSRIQVILMVLLNVSSTMKISASRHTQTSASTISAFTPGRNLLQTENASQSLVEKDDTVRVDPLDHFNKYREGYNITNKHYWGSLIFTGVFGYAIGSAWLVIGVLYGGFLLVSNFFSTTPKQMSIKRRSHCFKQCYLWPIFIAIFLTALALSASGVFLGGNARFRSRADTVVEIIINTANEASETIYNATGAMKGMEENLGDTELSNVVTVDSDVSVFLASTSRRLDTEADVIYRQARKNRRRIDTGLDIVFVTTTVIICLNMVAILSLLACGIFKFKKVLSWLIILCWFSTTLCWFFAGTYFFLEKFSTDTCNTFQSFQQNPYNNTLSSLLPCDELLSAKPVLSDLSAGIYTLVNQVNANISRMQRTFPNLASVCNPFSAPPEFEFQPNNCPVDTIRISDIPQILKAFTCSDTTNCKDGQFISFNDYRRVQTYTSSIQQILDAYPGMEDLVECDSVKDAFNEILSNHCKPLKRYARTAWAAMVALSVIMVAFVLLWTHQARHEQRFHSSDGSVKPNIANSENTNESTNHTEIL